MNVLGGGGGGDEWMGASFFCLLAGNYLLQSVREGLTFFIPKDTVLEAMTGLGSLLFAAWFAFAKLDKRMHERHIVLGALSVHFASVFAFATYFARTSEREYDPTVCVAFFIASSLGNVLSSSFVWGLAGKRAPNRLVYFSQCSNLGQLFGSFAGWLVLEKMGWGKPGVLFAVAVFLLGAVVCLLQSPAPNTAVVARARSGNTRKVKRVELYVVTLCAFQLVNSISQTLVGLRKRAVMYELNHDSNERSVLTTQMNAVSAVAILLVQFSGLLAQLSNQTALLAGPVVIGGGLLVQRYFERNHLGAISALVITTRVIIFALGKPAREALFAIMPDAHRIRVKPLIDGFFRDLGQILAALYHVRFGDDLMPQLALISAFLLATTLLTSGWELRSEESKIE